MSQPFAMPASIAASRARTRSCRLIAQWAREDFPSTCVSARRLVLARKRNPQAPLVAAEWAVARLAGDRVVRAAAVAEAVGVADRAGGEIPDKNKASRFPWQ